MMRVAVDRKEGEGLRDVSSNWYPELSRVTWKVLCILLALTVLFYCWFAAAVAVAFAIQVVVFYDYCCCGCCCCFCYCYCYCCCGCLRSNSPLSGFWTFVAKLSQFFFLSPTWYSLLLFVPSILLASFITVLRMLVESPLKFYCGELTSDNRLRVREKDSQKEREREIEKMRNFLFIKELYSKNGPNCLSTDSHDLL